jgi:hypothetical protein
MPALIVIRPAGKEVTGKCKKYPDLGLQNQLEKPALEKNWRLRVSQIISPEGAAWLFRLQHSSKLSVQVSFRFWFFVDDQSTR